MDPIALFSRWIHILSAIALMGGAIFMRYAFLPAAEELPETERPGFADRVRGHWRKFVFIGIGLLLLSGFYNYLALAHPAEEVKGQYHMLMGIKILIALVVFFFASALVGRSAGMQKLRDNSRQWLTITILLATIVVGIAGYLKVSGLGRSGPSEPVPVVIEG